MKRKKILILVPASSAVGGIANYFRVLKNKFSLDVEYFYRGCRSQPYRKCQLYEFCRAFKDLARFIIKIVTHRYSLIQSNTSLGLLALVRDGFFVLFSKMLRIKVIVFFRGLDIGFQEKLEKKKRYLFFLKWIFFRADALLVLSSHFRNKLKDWGYQKSIYTETTVVDEALVFDINEQFLRGKYDNKATGEYNILFLARLEKYKGIFEAVEAYQILKKNYPQLRLTIAGDGLEMDAVKCYTAENQVKDVDFLGYVEGGRKIKTYKKSHIYIFPSYSEGMPNSLLEAMAFGLPVVTSAVGGIKDFFVDGEMGFMTESRNPRVFANLIMNLLTNQELTRKISLHNFHYARDHFTSSKVVKRLENIYSEILCNL